jgi:predicted transglutaminase-like cysteine proteinase
LAAASILASAACVMTAPAEASIPKQPFMPVGATIEPPYGYFDYCHRRSSSCVEFGGTEASRQDERAIGASYWDLVFQPQSVVETKPQALSWVMADLSPEEWRAVVEINRRVNAEIRADTDEIEYRKRDFWALPRPRKGRKHGDCEDYVLQKRAELIAAGVPEGALSIAIAKTRRREVHAVLLIATPSGEFVLDNRSAWISRWYDVNYRWERRQIPGSQTWVRVTGSSPSV